MKRLELNIQLFAATASITNARQSVDVDNNSEVQRITFTVKRTSGTTYWQDNKTLTFKLKYYNDDNSQTTLTQTKQFNFPSSVSTKSAYVDFTVPHKDDGTQTINYEASITTGTSVGTLHPTGSAVLETIPRQSVRIRVSGEWRRAFPYVRINGQWVKATAYVRANGVWNRGG